MQASIILFFALISGIFFSYGQESSSSGDGRALERGPAVVAEKGLLQIEEQIDWFNGNGISLVISQFEISYGILDKLGMRVIIPSILRLKDTNLNTSSFGDTFILFDWYFFRTKEVLASVTSGVKLPTSSKPIVAIFSSQSFDIPFESQIILNLQDWYAEAEGTALFKVKSRKKIKFGNVYTFDFGFGPKYTFSNPRFFKTMFLVGRLTGIHTRFRFVEGVLDDNSGGTLVLLGPDVTIANTNIVVRGLFQLPILNRPFGIQNVVDFRAMCSFRLLF
jgi:hypothetical protein